MTSLASEYVAAARPYRQDLDIRVVYNDTVRFSYDTAYIDVKIYRRLLHGGVMYTSTAPGSGREANLWQLAVADTTRIKKLLITEK